VVLKWRVITRVTKEGPEEEFALVALEVADGEFARLLFCRVSVHRRVCYGERVGFNGRERGGWEVAEDLASEVTSLKVRVFFFFLIRTRGGFLVKKNIVVFRCENIHSNIAPCSYLKKKKTAGFKDNTVRYSPLVPNRKRSLCPSCKLRCPMVRNIILDLLRNSVHIQLGLAIPTRFRHGRQDSLAIPASANEILLAEAHTEELLGLVQAGVQGGLAEFVVVVDEAAGVFDGGGAVVRCGALVGVPYEVDVQGRHEHGVGIPFEELEEFAVAVYGAL
jgi:hypothetical protein